MSTTRRPRPTSTAASEPAADEALARLLATVVPPPAAGGPGGELRGEAEAAAAFREARLSPATTPWRRSMSAGKLLAVKTVIAVVSLSGGGVALAAATGHLPAHAGGHPSSAPAQSASASATHGKDAIGGHPSASTSRALQGLCHAYQRGAGSNPGKALASPAFITLINAAGGKDHVASYCAGVLASSPSAHSTAHPNGAPASHQTGKPTAHPTPQVSHKSHPSHPASGTEGNSDSGAGSMHVTNEPTMSPTVRPTAHPTGKPSLHPGAP